MSAVADKPRTARQSVRLSNRVAMDSAGFHWYSAGLAAERRDQWMRQAREGDEALRRTRVKFARDHHHVCMREIARALELS